MSRPTRTRQGKADELPVPAGSDDPTERKRVLNILAQRRYRKRKREHVKALESQLAGKTSVHRQAVIEPNIQASESPILDSHLINGPDPHRAPSNTQSPPEASSSREWLVTHDPTTSLQSCTQTSSEYPSHDAHYCDMGQMSLGCQAQGQLSIINLSGGSMSADFFTTQQVTSPESPIHDWPAPSPLDNSQAYIPSSEQPFSAWTWDALAFMPSVSLPSTPGPDLSSPENESTPPTDPSSSSPSPSSNSPPKTPSAPPTALPNSTITALQSYQATHSLIPPSLTDHELNAHRGFISIATLLDLTTQIFSLTASSPFCSPDGAPPPPLPPNLPANLHPTPLQLTTPHHPILDIIPWPVARNKLILVFSLSPDLRPPQAQSETALLDLVYDIEDSSEGVRVWGDCPYAEGNWELGSKVFRRWWWAFDREIVRRSNEWRRGRGVAGLGMGVGSVIGEVG